MKILFLGDYSNLHACLASELRKRGHQVTVVSDRGGYMQTQADIVLARKPGLLGSVKYLADIFNALPKLADYDVVQLINPIFLRLKPGKISYIFRELLNKNRSIFLTLAGNDALFVRACLDGKTFRYSEFRYGDKRSDFSLAFPTNEAGWLQRELVELTEMVYDRVDGAMSILPEYDMAARPYIGDKLAFTNIPVDLTNLPFSEINAPEKVNLFVGLSRGREIQKGTDRLSAMARKLEKHFPDRCRANIVSNLSLQQYLKEMSESHIVLDQLYSYSPATNALQAMALGRATASGAQPEYYDMIGESTRPVIDANPLDVDTLENTLVNFIKNPEGLKDLSVQGRALVERHNALNVVADKFEAHWSKILSQKN